MRNSYISKVVADMPDSGIKDFFALAESMPEALSLGIGEPDFKTPGHVRNVAIQSIQEAKTKYTENQGTLELREAVADYLKNRFQLTYKYEEEILITVGASEGIDLALRTLTNPGEEVLIVEPGYVSYVPCVQMSGGVPIHLEMRQADGFRLKPEQLLANITEKTKLLILPFPNNPTGAIMEKEDLEAIAPILVEHDIFVISDEIYAELTYGRNHVSIANLSQMKERCVILSGFSKAFAMTGWRLGYAAGPEEIISAMNKIHQFVIMSAGTTSQIAGLEAMTYEKRDEEITKMRGEYDERRKILVEGFRNMGLDCVEPLGAFYVYPSIQKTGLTSMEFCNKLLDAQKVAVIPGNAFGECGEGFVRCSYAYSIETIEECLRRIEEFIYSILY